MSASVGRTETMETLNAATFFVDRHVTEGRKDRVAFRTAGGATTYGQLQEQVNRAGNALRALGVQMEQRVLLLLHDGIEFAASFFGAIKIGAVPVPVSTMLRPGDYGWFFQDSRARVAIISEAMLAELGPVLDKATALENIVVVGRGGGGETRTKAPAPASAKQPHLAWEAWLASASAELEAAPTTKDDVAFWLYSSGSTGHPKGAVHLQHDMPFVHETYGKRVLGLTSEDRVFSAAKLFFAYGLGNSLYMPLGAGAEAYLHAERPTAEGVLRVVEQYRPTVFFAVPTLYAAMLHLAEASPRFDCSSLRLCVSAGEALPPEIWRRWKERFGVEIIDGIGTTEILHIFISNRPGEVKPGSTGPVVPGYEAVIVDEHGLPVPRGEIGNLRVRGDSIMSGYWNCHEKTRSVLFGDWIQTGDKYHEDQDGYFWYAGRSDDMLKVSGNWVSPIEVENALLAHPAVLEAAVVGHQDSDGLVKPKAFVVIKDAAASSDGLARELQSFVKSAIAPYKYPRWVEIVRELPKTATGKIQRFKLRAQVAEPA